MQRRHNDTFSGSKRSHSFTMKAWAAAMLLGIAAPVFAESAPVYDADSVQQQFENVGDPGQDLPPPPAPGQERAYVPEGAQVSPSVGVGSGGGSSTQRIGKIEQQITNLQTSASRIEALQTEVQSLRGQVEQLTHQLQTLQTQQQQLLTQQKSMFTDLDKRIAQQSAATPAVAPVAATQPKAKPAKAAESETASTQDAAQKPAVSQPNIAEEQQIYQSAYNFIKAKKYNEAVNTLQSMLQKYPSGQFASNAHYWLGELYGLMGKNDQAMSEFSTVVKTYPDSPRVSDAQLKVGLIFAAQSKWVDAKTAFKKVINSYPGTASARLASEQLKQIKQAGH